MIRQALGWRRDEPLRPGWVEFTHRLALAAAPSPPPPKAHSNRDLIPDIFDQGGIGSCVANAVALAYRAEQLREAPAGAPPAPIGSRLWLYWFARAFTRDTNGDSGTFVRYAAQAIAELGLPPESAWPYEDGPDRFKVRPDGEAERLAYDQAKDFAYLRIPERGDALIEQLKRVSAAGYLIVFGTQVSERFAADDFDAEAPLEPPAPDESIAGGHAMAIAGFDPDGFDVANSWGTGFGAGGFWKAAPGYLTWSESSDFTIFKRAPAYAAALRGANRFASFADSPLGLASPGAVTR